MQASHSSGLCAWALCSSACSPLLLQPTTWVALVPMFKGTWLGSQPLVKVVTLLLRAMPQIVQDEWLVKCGVPTEDANVWGLPMHVAHLKAFTDTQTCVPCKCGTHPWHRSRVRPWRAGVPGSGDWHTASKAPHTSVMLY